MEIRIPFNKPFLTGREFVYINESVLSGKISGNGIFTKKCQAFLEAKYGFKKALLTTSCTDALEMCAILAGIGPGDEVIVPSYTFVSTVLPFLRQGAKAIFVDSCIDNPNIDVNKIESHITEKTKAIVVVHYAGVACDMDVVMNLSKKYNLVVIEDAAQAIDSKYKDKYLGSIGDLAAFSFHETKNINSGEGGLIAINNDKYLDRSEIIWEKGTNRSSFFRGEINKYGWVDIGSSFLPSEIIAGYLWAQLECLDLIQSKRIFITNLYFDLLKDWISFNSFQCLNVPGYATNNGHMFYIIVDDQSKRQVIIDKLKSNGVLSVFHYQSLHKSDYYLKYHDGSELPNSDKYSDCLLRLPLYFELSQADIEFICNVIKSIEFS